jgi:dolichyl-phosphate beta-glucosyltransferase
MKKTIDLTIVIPAYNEEKRIVKTLSTLGDYFVDKKKDISVEILVVVNNTTDGTVNVIKDCQKKYPFIKYTNLRKRTGKGGAIAVGFRKASGKYIGFMDADGSNSPAQLMKLYRKIANNNSLDGVIGSRRVEGAKTRVNETPLRVMFSNMFNMLTKYGFGLSYKDTQFGLKIFTNEFAKEVSDKIYSTSWTMDINILLLAKYLNKDILESPITWESIEGSRFSIKNALIQVPSELLRLKAIELGYLLGVSNKFLSKNKELSYKSFVY